MRLQGTTELSINSETLEGDFGDVRAQVEQIKFDKGITVLALQPEVGKTEAFIRYCKANLEKNIAYFAPNHDLLNEVENRLEGVSNVVHLWGAKKCRYIIKGDPYLKLLNDLGLSIKYQCAYCNHKDKCSYLNQFHYSEPAIILAPYASIGLHDFGDFDVFFIDELNDNCKKYSWELSDSELKKAVDILKSKVTNPILDDLLKVISNPEYLHKIDINRISRIFSIGLLDLHSNLEKEKYNLLAKVLSDINNSSGFLKWKDIYKESDGYKKDLGTYYEPYIYKLFELAESIPIVILDATFNEELFKDLLRGYDGEFGINKFDINVYKTSIQNKDSVIYRVKPTAWYPKSSIIHNEEISIHLINKVENLSQFYTKIGKSVGIITYEDVLKEHFGQDDTLYYGNLRGENKLKEFDVLILLGTFQPNLDGVMKKHNELYLTNLVEYNHYYYEQNKDGTLELKLRTVPDYLVKDIKDLYQPEYLFTWDSDIRKVGWLIEYLKQYKDPIDGTRNYNDGWLDNVNIEKTNETIKIYDETHTISLRLDKSKVILEREGGRIHELIAKKDDDTYIIFFQRKHPYLDKRRQLVRTQKIVDGNEEWIKMDLIQELIREDEQYQAIYRIRPLSSDKIIYMWGIVPENVKDELSYKEILNIDSHIANLEKEVQKKERKEFDIETFFEEGKRLTEIVEKVMGLGYGKTAAYNKVNKLIDNSPWEKVKTKVDGIDKPVYILKKA